MPRTKRTVGFWRGPTNTSKIALLPAPDRFSGTPVDGWPPAVIRDMRRALLTKKREHPDITDSDLVVFAETWLRVNVPQERRRGKKGKKAGTPSRVPKGVSKAHVRALLAPPPSSRQKKPGPPARIDRSPRPTTLSGAELAAVIRSNQRMQPAKLRTGSCRHTGDRRGA